MREAHMRTFSGRAFGLRSIGLAGIALLFALPAMGAEDTTPGAGFSGLWARPYIGFEPPPSGPGPVTSLFGLRPGRSSVSQFVGDYANPILTPRAAAIVKRHGEIELAGEAAPNPSNQCLPMALPYVLQRQQIQFLQQKDQITILYAEDHQVRRVRLNANHPTPVIPSWYGDSVGRFEGDTLVIDTIGIKVGPYSMVDSYGTPHSEDLHVVERYRLIDYDAAAEAAKRSERVNTRLSSENPTGNGVGIDPDYKGKALQVRFTVEDRTMFTMPWSGVVTYWRASGDWVERVCAENPREFGRERQPPTAARPDF
jgi:hypothetical protein